MRQYKRQRQLKGNAMEKETTADDTRESWEEDLKLPYPTHK